MRGYQRVNSIVMHAIQKDQSMRYQSATELLDDLNKVLKEPHNGFNKTDGQGQSYTRTPSIGKEKLAVQRIFLKKRVIRA